MKKSLLLVLLLGTGLAWGRVSDKAAPWYQWGWWKPRVEGKIALAKQQEWPIVFLGDSITHFWESKGKGVFAREFKGLSILNAANRGDRTEQTIWMAEHLPWDTMGTKAIMLMIGTNNTGWRPESAESTEDTVAGVRAIFKVLKDRCPQAKVLLLAIFPRGASASDGLRVRNEKINAILPTLCDGKQVVWMNINAKLLEADGSTLSKEMARDLLHPEAKGYEIWAAAVKPWLLEQVK